MTLLEEAIEVAKEYVAVRQRCGFWPDPRPSCRDLVRELGIDMRGSCNQRSKAVAIAIIAAEWMAMPERLTGLALTGRSVDSSASIRPTLERHYDRAA